MGKEEIENFSLRKKTAFLKRFFRRIDSVKLFISRIPQGISQRHRLRRFNMTQTFIIYDADNYHSRNMLTDGVDINLIMKYSGLTQEQIENLK